MRNEQETIETLNNIRDHIFEITDAHNCGFYGVLFGYTNEGVLMNVQAALPEDKEARLAILQFIHKDISSQLDNLEAEIEFDKA